MFEKDLERITCSFCLLQTSASLPPSLPHFLILSVPCFLFLSLSPSLSVPTSLPLFPLWRMWKDLLFRCMHDLLMTGFTELLLPLMAVSCSTSSVSVVPAAGSHRTGSQDLVCYKSSKHLILRSRLCFHQAKSCLEFPPQKTRDP